MACNSHPSTTSVRCLKMLKAAARRRGARSPRVSGRWSSVSRAPAPSSGGSWVQGPRGALAGPFMNCNWGPSSGYEIGDLKVWMSFIWYLWMKKCRDDDITTSPSGFEPCLFGGLLHYCHSKATWFITAKQGAGGLPIFGRSNHREMEIGPWEGKSW